MSGALILLRWCGDSLEAIVLRGPFGELFRVLSCDFDELILLRWPSKSSEAILHRESLGEALEELGVDSSELILLRRAGESLETIDFRMDVDGSIGIVVRVGVVAPLSFKSLYSGEASDEFGGVTCLFSLLLLGLVLARIGISMSGELILLRWCGDSLEAIVLCGPFGEIFGVLSCDFDELVILLRRPSESLEAIVLRESLGEALEELGVDSSELILLRRGSESLETIDFRMDVDGLIGIVVRVGVVAPLSFESLYSGEASVEFGEVTCLFSLLLLDDSGISGSFELVRELRLILRKLLRPLLVEESSTVSPSVMRSSSCFAGLTYANWQAISLNSAERTEGFAVLSPSLLQISGSSLLSHAKGRRSNSSREIFFRR